MIPPRLTRTAHLVRVIAETERLAALVAAAAPERRAALVDRARHDAAVASLRLDGSPVDAVDLDRTPRRQRGRAASDPRSGTWVDALRVAERPTAELVAAEYDGVVAALTADDLAGRLQQDPDRALRELHRRLTRGLVRRQDAGRPRRTEQAVGDASIGRILFFTPEPARVPDRLAHLCGWLVSAAAREHPVIVSGVVHVELLALHPFEAANGRLARAAARLLLRAGGLDPDGLTAVEVVLVEDALGYYEEVARTLRRRDVTIWLERWAEAVAEALRRCARELGVLSVEVPARARVFLDRWQEATFTIADYRAEVGVEPQAAQADLDALLDAGLIQRVPASRGLRFRCR